MSGDIFQEIQRLRDQVALLWARVGPVIRPGGVSTEQLVGVLPTHQHGGTGQGGGTLAPALLELPVKASDPDYVDGYAIIYWFSGGGDTELRVRWKSGATEYQATILTVEQP